MGILNIGRDSVADSHTFESCRAAGAARASIWLPPAQASSTSASCPVAPTPRRSASSRRSSSSARSCRRSPTAGVLVSIDTWRAETIAAAIDAGAALINDTSGLLDPAVADIAASSGAGLVLMHTRAEPKQEHFPSYEDPVPRRARVPARARQAGAQTTASRYEQILLDPGLDYAKAPAGEHRGAAPPGRAERCCERPILLAVSRKYFIGMLADALPEDRLAGTIAALEFGVSAGAQIVRVHDVAQVSQYLRLRAALHGEGEVDMLGRRDDDAPEVDRPQRLSGLPNASRKAGEAPASPPSTVPAEEADRDPQHDHACRPPARAGGWCPANGRSPS